MQALLDPRPGNLLLLVAPRAGGPLMIDLIAQLACRGPLRVLDGGNHFRVYECNRAIARALYPNTAELPRVLERIRLARAFTCYQVETLLSQTPAQATPTLVLDLLSTFYDESVSLAESQRLLQTCIHQLHRLNRAAPVAVSVRPSPLGARPELLETLQDAAGQNIILEPHTPPPPPRLFE